MLNPSKTLNISLVHDYGLGVVHAFHVPKDLVYLDPPVSGASCTGGKWV